MKANLRQAIEFCNKTKGIEHILQIVLFGSVARGKDTLTSDVDIAIVHDADDALALANAINKKKTERIQTTLVPLSKLADETEIMGALAGEGILLYGRPITVQEKKTDLLPKTLISYSLVGLEQTEKVKLNKALYGTVSSSKGIVTELNAEKINNGVLLAERKAAKKLIQTLRIFGASYKEIPCWTY